MWSFHDRQLYAKALRELDVSASKFLGAGQESIAIELTDGTVLKLTELRSDLDIDWDEIMDSQFHVPILDHGEIEVGNKSVTYFIQPKVDTPVSEDDVQEFIDSLEGTGYFFRDSAGRHAHTQLGYYYDDFGKREVRLLDPMAVKYEPY